MISISMVRPVELEDSELGLIVQYCNTCWKPFPIEDVIKRVQSGGACIYRVQGPEVKGIVILALSEDNDLYIETVAGKGMVRNFKEVYDAIKQVALSCGAKEIYSYVGRPSLKRLYERRTKATLVAELYKESLT